MKTNKTPQSISINYTLNYQMEDGLDDLKVSFTNINELMNRVWAECDKEKDGVVYLCAAEFPELELKDDEISISQNKRVIYDFIESIEAINHCRIKYFIQKYGTFDDAYSVALSMREPNPKCYNVERFSNVHDIYTDMVEEEIKRLSEKD